MTTIPASSAVSTGSVAGGPFRLLRGIEAWLDDKGRKAWIFAMVLGFIFAWPVGLFLVFYITATNRWSSDKMFGCTARRHDRSQRHSQREAYFRATQPSGNAAFDSYKSEMLKRLEDEQTAFESFLGRLREAKDKSEFDAFMQDRARETRAAETSAPEAAPLAARTGEY